MVMRCLPGFSTCKPSAISAAEYRALRKFNDRPSVCMPAAQATAGVADYEVMVTLCCRDAAGGDFLSLYVRLCRNIYENRDKNKR